MRKTTAALLFLALLSNGALAASVDYAAKESSDSQVQQVQAEKTQEKSDHEEKVDLYFDHVKMEAENVDVQVEDEIEN